MKAQRAWAQLSTMGDVVDIAPFEPQRELGPNCYLGELDLEVGWWHQGSSTPGSVFDADEMSKLITRVSSSPSVCPRLHILAQATSYIGIKVIRYLDFFSRPTSCFRDEWRKIESRRHGCPYH